MIQEANREISLMRHNGIPKVERRKSPMVVSRGELKLDLVLKEIKHPALRQIAESMLELDKNMSDGDIDGDTARVRHSVQKEMLRLIALDMALRRKSE